MERKQKTCLTIREQEKEKTERGGCGQETRLHCQLYFGGCATSNAKVFSFRKGVGTSFVETHPAPPVKLEWPPVGKAFLSAEQKGHWASDPLLLGTKVPNVLMCCLSAGLKMLFVISLALFMSLC